MPTSSPSPSNEPVRVLITGSREYTSRKTIARALSRVYREHGRRQLIVVHGDARGADRLAGKICADFPDSQLRAEPHPARWRDENGTKIPGAGPIRNQEMVNLGAAVCLAFYAEGATNIGTGDCVRRAWKADIPVREHWDGI